MDTTVIPEILKKALALPDFAMPEFFVQESRKTEWSLGVFLKFVRVEVDFYSIKDLKSALADLSDYDVFRIRQALYECENKQTSKIEPSNIENVLNGENDIFLINSWFKKQDRNENLHPFFAHKEGGEIKLLYNYFVSANYAFASFEVFRKAFFELVLEWGIDNVALRKIAESLFKTAKQNVQFFNESLHPYEEPFGENEKYKGMAQTVRVNIVLNGIQISYVTDDLFMSRKPMIFDNRKLAYFSYQVMSLVNKYFELAKSEKHVPAVLGAETGNPTLRAEIVDNVFNILSDFFPKEQQTELRQRLSTGGSGLERLRFSGNGNRLTDTFKKLLEHGFIVGCQKRELINWIIQNFTYRDNKKGYKEYVFDTVEKVISRNHYPCKNPLIEIQAGEITEVRSPIKRNSKW